MGLVVRRCPNRGSRCADVALLRLSQHASSSVCEHWPCTAHAGSERVGKSGAEGQQLLEAQHINKSLRWGLCLVCLLCAVRKGLRSFATLAPFHSCSPVY